jgi:hypothetical protein
MEAKITRVGVAWIEGKRGETQPENLYGTEQNCVDLRLIATYDDEFLLKACASRQEKPSECRKNGAV